MGNGDAFISSVTGILTAIIGVAIIAVLVSKKADTANVFNAGGKFFGTLISRAVSPVSY